MTTLMRPERGRKRGGMLSQVLRPMRTALSVGGNGEGGEDEGEGDSGGGCLVMRAK